MVVPVGLREGIVLEKLCVFSISSTMVELSMPTSASSGSSSESFATSSFVLIVAVERCSSVKVDGSTVFEDCQQ